MYFCNSKKPKTNALVSLASHTNNNIFSKVIHVCCLLGDLRLKILRHVLSGALPFNGRMDVWMDDCLLIFHPADESEWHQPSVTNYRNSLSLHRARASCQANRTSIGLHITCPVQYQFTLLRPSKCSVQPAPLLRGPSDKHRASNYKTLPEGPVRKNLTCDLAGWKADDKKSVGSEGKVWGTET